MDGSSASSQKVSAKYVVLSDTTLWYSYRDFPLLDFLPCAPTNTIPDFVYRLLRGPAPAALPDGRALYAPYSIRLLESALLQRYQEDQVVVPHQDYIENFIGSDTEIVAVGTMDPLGYGPLTMSFTTLFNNYYPYVRKEFERLILRITKCLKRKGNKKARILVGGPGVWEFTISPEELDRLGISFAFQGEADDIVCDLFGWLSEGVALEAHESLFPGFYTFDSNFHKSWITNKKFITRGAFSRQAPKLEQIPEIRRPSMKSLVEVMRGCGIGCDFCEVTLRPLRYYPPERVAREVEINVRLGGFRNAWLQTDEVFAYMHGKNFEPNQEALISLFKAVMSVRGVESTNPTHGRISIPSAYPDLIRNLSQIAKASPSNWIGIQVGIETGSDRLAKIHMPNKTLPLKIGQDGSWAEIVWRGTYVLNKYYWRPAFTVQVGQPGETPEDNWETVALINWLSNSSLDDGRPFEFTVTPMQNVPLGRLKSRNLTANMLDESQLAVYYASYRHLAKMASRNAMRDSGGNPLVRLATAAAISFGGKLMFQTIKTICKQRGIDVDKVNVHGLDRKLSQPRLLNPRLS
jgi:radical SAM superfamily enzyme YgiQ (UPF0313 family)